MKGCEVLQNRRIGSNFKSSIHKSNLTPWATTTEENQYIYFTNAEGDIENISSIWIETPENQDLYVRICPSDYCMYIPEEDMRAAQKDAIGFCNMLQIMGPAGLKYRIYIQLDGI
jgi:hypothetical protein